jgi:hypothetical protein
MKTVSQNSLDIVKLSVKITTEREDTMTNPIYIHNDTVVGLREQLQEDLRSMLDGQVDSATMDQVCDLVVNSVDAILEE